MCINIYTYVCILCQTNNDAVFGFVQKWGGYPNVAILDLTSAPGCSPSRNSLAIMQ